MISKELLSEIMDDKVKSIRIMNDTIFIYFENNNQEYFIDIYELTHKNLKEWAKLKNVFGIIDWSEEPKQIFKKAEELKNEIN